MKIVHSGSVYHGHLRFGNPDGFGEYTDAQTNTKHRGMWSSGFFGGARITEPAPPAKHYIMLLGGYHNHITGESTIGLEKCLFCGICGSERCEHLHPPGGRKPGEGVNGRSGYEAVLNH